ncbi:MAG: radical SAM protein [Synergistaceae bacterium]|nr:radical SAM protein [Synergistaceae bacterium]
MMQARWWKKNGDVISCNLCFRGCNIKQNCSGKCGVRFNKDGVLISPCLGKFCACAIDPVEKKPLFHWNSGKFIYSLGSVDCTMDCPFCQNHSIAFPARALYEQTVGMPEFAVDEIIRNVKESGLDLLAFTYNEPTLQAEYICEAAPALHDAGMSVALVTNGAMSHEVAKDLILCLDENDAANIDIKAFNPKTYKTLGGELDTVKKNIELFINAGIHVELTNLVVTGLNDDIEEFIAMVDWIASISDRIPLHITRYFPARNYNKPPTDIELLYSLASMAIAKLNHVHIGNV